MMRIGNGTLRAAVWLVCSLALASCGTESVDPYDGPVTDEAYVQIMTDLLLLDVRPLEGDSLAEREARTDSARLAIVSGHGLTGDDILEFARIRGAEASHMERLWEEITHRFDSARVANLSRSTEARSEAEGKLGADAGEAVPGAAPAAAASRQPGDSARTPPPVSRRAREALERLRPGQDTPPASGDSTSDSP